MPNPNVITFCPFQSTWNQWTQTQMAFSLGGCEITPPKNHGIQCMKSQQSGDLESQSFHGDGP